MSGRPPFRHDFIAVINLSDEFIPGVRMGVHQMPLTTLLSRGTARRVNNLPAQPLAGLAPGEVWITLVPSWIHEFSLGTASTQLTPQYLPVGGALYIPGAACDADLNADGTLNFFDISQFLNMYNQQDAAADMNNDGHINFFDIAAYVALYNAGCP